MEIPLVLFLFGYLYSTNAQRTIIDAAGADFGIFGADQLVDLGPLDGSGLGRTGINRRTRLGGSLAGIGSHTDFIRGLRPCRGSAVCTLQWIPDQCRYTPVRWTRFGDQCSECPIDLCEVDTGRWRPRRRRWRQRIFRYLCRRFGRCGIFGRGRGRLGRRERRGRRGQGIGGGCRGAGCSGQGIDGGCLGGVCL